MRTTVTIDPDVEQLLRADMHRQRLSFKQSLNRAVRAGLLGTSGASVEPFVVRSRAMGLRPGIDERRFNQLADELEAEESASRMRHAEHAPPAKRPSR